MGRTDRQTDRRTDRPTDRVRRNMCPSPREEVRITSCPSLVNISGSYYSRFSTDAKVQTDTPEQITHIVMERTIRNTTAVTLAHVQKG